MRRPSRYPALWRAGIVALALLLLGPGAARATSDQPITFEGSFFEAAPDGGPDPTPGDTLAVGDAWVFVGHVTGFADYLVPHVDPATSEYTVVIHGAVVENRSTFAGFVALIVAGAISFDVYEDSRAGGTPALFVPDPPGAMVPAYFADGTRVLRATLTDLTAVFARGRTGSWSGTVGSTEGAWVPYLPPPRWDKEYFVGGELTGQAVPSGFQSFSLGEIRSYWVDPVEPATWGRLKRIYRD